MVRKAIVTAAGVLMLLAIAPAYSALDDELPELTQTWAKVRYEDEGDQRKQKMRELIRQADALAENYPAEADSHLWAGVLRCSLAEVEDKLEALRLVKDCRTNLERALAMNPATEDGYVYAVLGTLYAKVPGWPLAFGDKKKAEELLQKGVAVAPQGMNTNYFYAKFLYEQGNMSGALDYIERAAKATPPYPPEQSLPVAVRQREIRELNDKIKSGL